MFRIRLKLLLHLVVFIDYFSFVKISQVNCEDVENDDDELISKLLDIPMASSVDDSDVSHILKILEASEQAATTEVMPSTSTTVSTPTTEESTTQKPSPFFKTERPFRFSSRNLQDTDAHLNSIISTLMESETLLNANNKSDLISRRSDSSHYPPLNNLLLSTAEAVWDVSKPVFLKTKVGRKVSYARDAITLPLRTFGNLKHKFLDLTSGHYGHHKRSIIHDHHHGHHGWGWHDPVYIKYEPENSLFKAWLRQIYRSVRPVVISKIRLKKKLLRIKLRFLAGIVRFLKSAKLQKFLASVRALVAYLRSLRPNLVVLKEAGHHHHHDHGWGWEPPKGWGWSSTSSHESGWKPGTPPTNRGWARQSPSPTQAPKPEYGPPPTGGYNYAASSPPEISYGPPVMNSYGDQQQPYQSYGAPPTPRPSPEAYNQNNVYQNYYSPPSQDLMAPQQYAQSSENVEKEHAPTYAKYLKQFGINPSSLSETGDGSDSIRNFRETKEDDVPYLTKEDEAEAKQDEEEDSVKRRNGNIENKPSRM